MRLWEFMFCNKGRYAVYIVQEVENLKGAMTAQDTRNLEATKKVGLNPLGCDTPDALADEILALRQEIQQLKEEK